MRECKGSCETQCRTCRDPRKTIRYGDIKEELMYIPIKLAQRLSNCHYLSEQDRKELLQWIKDA